MTLQLKPLAAYCLALCLIITACKTENSSREAELSSTEEQVPIPAFNRDSAYEHIVTQLEFGPRNPGSEGIQACREWMVSKLRGYGSDVIRQKFTATLHDGEKFPSENIIAQFNPENRTRIVLAAHYDTRAIAEEDPDVEKRNTPIPGADDGASGVAVLIEIARLLHEEPIGLGVDLVFFDAEDQGTRHSIDDPDNTSWCIGAQYWSANLHQKNYKPRFGILLDMVGAEGAFFNKENLEGIHPHAREIHQLYSKVWNLAAAMGKGRYFQNRTIAGIIDDHYYVNKIARIPMIDIISKPPPATEGFGPHWHTHGDDLSVIDRNTLGAVGQVVTAVVYRTAGGNF